MTPNVRREDGSLKKITIFWITLSFITGATLGVLGGALFVSMKVLRYETDTMAMAAAETTFSVTTPLIMIHEKDGAARIDAFETAARRIVVAGVVSLHTSLPFLSDEKKRTIEGVLHSLARNREKLEIGRFSEPPLDHIEEILNKYEDL